MKISTALPEESAQELRRAALTPLEDGDDTLRMMAIDAAAEAIRKAHPWAFRKPSDPIY